MSYLKIFGLLGFILLISVSFAATCAQKSYTTSCSKCSFDQNGKMDQSCYEKYQGSGQACLFAAYPLESMAYTSGNCPAIDACIERLQTCKAMYSSGNDLSDCATGDITNCFVQGDRCVAMAVKNCNEPPPVQPEFDAPPAAWCDGFFFLIIPLFLGIAFVKR